MKTGFFHFNLSKHAFIAFLGAMLFFMAAEPALASNTSGGGLPFDDWMTNIRTSIRGLRANGTKTYVKSIICCLY